MTRKQYKAITKAVKAYQSNLNTEERHSVCCWETSRGFAVSRDFPKRTNSKVAITSLDKFAPIDNVTSRLAWELEKDMEGERTTFKTCQA